jgi:hypothetical protein
LAAASVGTSSDVVDQRTIDVEALDNEVFTVGEGCRD